MLAVSASDGQHCGLGGKRGGADDDTGYANEVRDVVSCEVADGELRGGRMEQQLVLRKFDVPLRGVDYALCARFECCFKLFEVSQCIPEVAGRLTRGMISAGSC